MRELSELEQQAFDAQIDAAHAAVEKAESEAQAVLLRLSKIPGCQAMLRDRRSLGALPNPWASGRENLSQQTAILRADPALASWLATRAGKPLPGVDPRKAEAEAAKAASVESMEKATEALRSSNQARRQQREHEAVHGRWDRFHGRMV